MTSLLSYLFAFLGGGFGVTLRLAVNQADAALLGAGFWGTPFVNITGSFAMGLLAGWFAFRGEGSGQSRSTRPCSANVVSSGEWRAMLAALWWQGS